MILAFDDLIIWQIISLANFSIISEEKHLMISERWLLHIQNRIQKSQLL